MSIKSSDLENRERGMKLYDRETKTERKERASSVELKLLKERIAEVRATLKPRNPIACCNDCYRRGWAAAVAAIDGVVD